MVERKGYQPPFTITPAVLQLVADISQVWGASPPHREAPLICACAG